MTRFITRLVLVSLIVCLSVPALAQTERVRAAYYTSWRHSTQALSEVDWTVITHIIAFVNGLDGSNNVQDWVGANISNAVIAAAHANGRKALISFGGMGVNMNENITAANRAATIHSLCEYIFQYGYDGIDWDNEVSQNATDLTNFFRAFKDSTTARGSVKLITAYTGSSPAEYSTAEPYFDIAFMWSYDMSGVWYGYYSSSWYVGPLFNGGWTFPGTSVKPPCIDDWVHNYITAGFPRSKLCIGSSMGAQVWEGGENTPTGGVTAARQRFCVSNFVNDPCWPTRPIAYADVYYAYWKTLYTGGIHAPGYYGTLPELWDSVTQTSYVSSDETGNVNDRFISFDNERTVARKWKYVVDTTLGGLFFWDLNAAYMSGRPAGQRYPMVNALRLAIAGDTLPPLPTGSFSVTPDTLPSGGGNVTLAWSSTNATSANISPGIGSVALNGNRVVLVSTTTTFALTLSNIGGSRLYTVRVVVGVPPPPPPDSTNKALGRPATASSIQGTGFEAGNANDGLTNTRWSSSYADNQWWQVDLGLVTSVNRVYTNWEAAYPSQFRISVSLDNQNFTDVATRNLTAPGPSETQFTLVSARYVRITGVTRATQYGVSLWEIGVYGTTLPGGQGRQDITVQALPPIALITQPTGNGSRDIEVIRDGNAPPVGSSDPTQQYDTYNGGAPRAFDWIGYQFPTTHTFSAVIFQEGMQFSGGGWFTTLTVQVRINGSWVDVQNLQSTPPYAGANGINYETYELSFAPVAGDGIRIAGTPGGSAHFISVGELRVLNNGTTGILPASGIPRDYALYQNYPNPFNPTTRIQYNLPVGADVSIVVYNVLGQEVATLVKGYVDAGRHLVDFSAENLTNGVYFYSIKTGNFSDMKKMVLLK